MFDFDGLNPLAQFNSLIHRRASQEMKTYSFGSEMEAQSGGSSASFRESDSPEYVSAIMSESPVSFIGRFPNETNQIRQSLGLGDLELPSTESAELPETPISDQPQILQAGLLPSISGVAEWISSNFVQVGVGLLALVLVLGGLIIIALSSDTVKTAVKDGVKAAAV